jgi:DNA-binding NarL/FixJ family response regulator
MEQRELNDFFAPHEREGAQGASTPFALQYAPLKSGVEASPKAVESRRREALSEAADPQLRAVAALEECAIATFLLTNALHDASRQRFDAIAYERVRFVEQTRHFLDCAQLFVLAFARCAETEGSVFRKGGVSAPAVSDGFEGRIRSLTPRQRRTLSLLLAGCPNKVIAYELGVAESTIKAHVTAILRKLQVHSRAQVIAAVAGLKRFESVQLEATLAPEGGAQLAIRR